MAYNSEKDSIREQIEELDKRLIAQEHRVFRIVSNIFKYATQERDEERLKVSIGSLITYILTRQTAVLVTSISAGLISLVALYISYQSMRFLGEQNEKIEQQNSRLIQQNQLAEADRRSSLVFLFNNIMDALDAELRNPTQDTTSLVKYGQGTYGRLSRQLIGRIIALSRRLEPYRYYDYAKDSLGPLTSPERGQLIVNLLESGIDTASLREIYSRGQFSYANLKDYSKTNAYLRGINMPNANLTNTALKGADLREVNLENAKLTNSNLQKSDMSRANLIHCDLQKANLSNATLNDASLHWALLEDADMTSANLFGTDFHQANLRSAKLQKAEMVYSQFAGTDMRETIWMDANISEVVFDGADLSYAVFHRSKSDTAYLDHKSFIDSLSARRVIGLDQIDEEYRLEKIFLRFVLSRSATCEFVLVPRDSVLSDYYGGLLIPEEDIVVQE